MYITKHKIKMEKMTRKSEDLKDMTSLVDVSGYIPNEVQYARMQAAGSRMTLNRMVNYNFDLDQMIKDAGGIDNLTLDNISSLSLGHYADVKDINNFVNERLTNLTKKFNTYKEEVSKLKEEKQRDDFNRNYLFDLVNQWKQNPELFKRFQREHNINLD